MGLRMTTARGRLAAHRLAPPSRPAIRSVAEAIHYGQAWRSARSIRNLLDPLTLEWQRANAEHFDRSLEDVRALEGGSRAPIGFLFGSVFRPNGHSLDLGLMSCRVVTDAGVGFIVDAFQGLVTASDMRYHGLGTSSTAESATDTALLSELTTQYATDNTRATGSLGEKSGDAKTFETVATNTVDASATITEHGVLSNASVGSGVLIDRSVFTGVPLVSAESLATTYQFTLPSGG